MSCNISWSSFGGWSDGALCNNTEGGFDRSWRKGDGFVVRGKNENAETSLPEVVFNERSSRSRICKALSKSKSDALPTDHPMLVWAERIVIAGRHQGQRLAHKEKHLQEQTNKS